MNKKLVSLLLIIITVGSAFLILNRNQSSALGNCYFAKVGSSDSLLTITALGSEKYRGTLIFHHFEKDSSYGTFTGSKKNNQLKIDFKFWSEGVLSTRPISFQIQGDQLIGEGFSYSRKSNCSNISYQQGLGLIPYALDLPLHLMPQIRLGYLETKGAKPIDSMNISYLPKTGEIVELGRIYYWDLDSWNQIFKPDLVSDYGNPMIEANDKVLSVSTVQDCVFESEKECNEVTEIYSKLINKNSYHSTTS